MSRKKEVAKLTTRLPSGKKRTHGGYSFLATGRLPEHRKYVERYLTAARGQLIQDLGGEENLSAGQIIIVDRTICKLGVLRCIEEHVRETHVFQGNRLNSALSKNYLAYSNSLRLDLQALGIDKKRAGDILDLGKYIQARDAEKAATTGQVDAAKAVNQAQDAQDSRVEQGGNGGDGSGKGLQGGGIVAPASTSSQIPGEKDVED